MIAPAPVTVKVIAGAVSAHFGVGLREITSQRRDKHVIWPRQVTVGLSVRLTACSLQRIGALLGGRDHTTILNARRRFDARIATDPVAAAQVAELDQVLRDGVLSDSPQRELTLIEDECDQRTAHLALLEESIGLAERRFAAIRRSFDLVAMARAVARARTAVIIAEHTNTQGIARRELEERLDQLMRVAEGGHV